MFITTKSQTNMSQQGNLILKHILGIHPTKPHKKTHVYYITISYLSTYREKNCDLFLNKIKLNCQNSTTYVHGCKSRIYFKLSNNSVQWLIHYFNWYLLEDPVESPVEVIFDPARDEMLGFFRLLDEPWVNYSLNINILITVGKCIQCKKVQSKEVLELKY